MPIVRRQGALPLIPEGLVIEIGSGPELHAAIDFDLEPGKWELYYDRHAWIEKRDSFYK